MLCRESKIPIELSGANSVKKAFQSPKINSTYSGAAISFRPHLWTPRDARTIQEAFEARNIPHINWGRGCSHRTFPDVRP